MASQFDASQYFTRQQVNAALATAAQNADETNTTLLNLANAASSTAAAASSASLAAQSTASSAANIATAAQTVATTAADVASGASTTAKDAAAAATAAQLAASSATVAASNASAAAVSANEAAASAQGTASAAQANAVAAQTAASTAASSASSALSQLDLIGEQNVLSAGNKPAVILDYNTIIAQQPGIDTQATGYGLIALKAAYDTSITQLTTDLGSWSTPVAWNDTSSYSTIVGATFIADFQAVYTDCQAVLNAIYAAAQTLANNAQTSANTANSVATAAASAASGAQAAATAAASAAAAALLTANQAQATSATAVTLATSALGTVPTVVSVMPAVGAANTYVYLTTAGGGYSVGLYQSNGTTWVKGNTSSLVVDQITAGQIAAGAISAAAIAADAINANAIAAGAVTANAIAAGAITANAIAAGSVTANAIAAGSVTATAIEAGAVTADAIAAGAINASMITAGTLTAGLIYFTDGFCLNNLEPAQAGANVTAQHILTTMAYQTATATASTAGAVIPGLAFSLNAASTADVYNFFGSMSGCQTAGPLGTICDIKLFVDGNLSQDASVSYSVLNGTISSSFVMILSGLSAGAHTITLFMQSTLSTATFEFFVGSTCLCQRIF